MKGLLLKEYYMIIKYCRSLLLIIAVFLAVSFFSEDNNMFLSIYPVVFAGLIPVTLIAYDEREKWDIYSAALPYSKSQLVSSKYLAGLISELGVIILSAALNAFRMNRGGNFETIKYVSYLTSMISLGMIAPAILLPFMFKFGAEKGRIVFYLAIGVICAASAAGMENYSQVSLQSASVLSLVLIVVAVVLIYILSWLISIALYKKRQL